MSNHLIDLTGQRFSRLLVLERGEDFISIRKSGNRKGKLEKNVRWKCQCDCGKIILAESSSLKRKNFPTRSCGCFGDDILRNLHIIIDYRDGLIHLDNDQKLAMALRR